jgi:sigma-B regulation protein RsbU (phosphoserine phosphatase)
MARSKALLRSAAQEEHADPGRILKKANLELLDGNEMFMFITVFLGILNVRTGELTYGNAAHVSPILIDKEGRCELVELPPGKPLGIRKQGGYETQRRLLLPGDSLLVFTDGVTEAESGAKGFYGEERLLSLLRSLSPANGTAAAPLSPAPPAAGAARYVEAVLGGVKSFCAADPRSDDIAVVCVSYLGNEYKKKGIS